MVDLSKHLERARQAIDRRQYGAAIERCLQCQDVDPTNVELYELLIQAAKKRQAEGGGGGLLGGFGMPSFTKDPHKLLSAACKKVSKNPDIKALRAAGDAAVKVAETGVKKMYSVAILFFDEGKASGLFNAELLWGRGHAYHARFKLTKAKDDLEQAIGSLYELERGKPDHPEAGRTAKNWEAEMSIARRSEGSGKSGDYRSQLASTDEARRNEVMNKQIRTEQDAADVLTYIDADLQAKPEDKALWVKKGDVHRRVMQWAEARTAYQKAAALDEHDFLVVMRLGETDIGELKHKIASAQKAGQDVAELNRQLSQRMIDEYRLRTQRQPTEMAHQFNLGECLYRASDVDGAAGAFQKAVNDPRFKRKAHNYLGHCFMSKNLLDLAVQQYTSCLSLIEDDLSDEAKDVRYYRGKAYEALGKRDDAIADFTRLVELDLSFKDAAQRLEGLRGS